MWRNPISIWAPAKKMETALIPFWLSEWTIKRHVANPFIIIIPYFELLPEALSSDKFYGDTF